MIQICFFVVFLSLKLKEIDGQSGSCRQICGTSNAFNIPSCPNEKIEPQFDPTCNCVVGYKCCPLQCPTTNVSCQQGVEYASTTIDDCACRVKTCKPCPRMPRPTCQTDCEELQQISDPFNGCSVYICEQKCPQLVTLQCPSCDKQETFVNDSFCGCQQNRCMPKPCPAPTPLPPKACALIEKRTTDCGCEEQFYDEVNFCVDKNAAAANLECAVKCNKKVVQSMASPCGCDVATCVSAVDADICDAIFSPSFSSSPSCPEGSVVRLGTTPCGSQRQICLRCEDIKQTNDTCDPKCFNVEKTTDVNGCPIEVCVLRQCPSTDKPVCKSCERIGMKTDDCGCIKFSCNKILTCVEGGESSTACSASAAGTVSGTEMVQRVPDVLKCGCQPRCADGVNSGGGGDGAAGGGGGTGAGDAAPALLTIGINSEGKYRLVQQPTSWVAAKTFCRMRGGDLATFYDLNAWLSVADIYFQWAFVDPSFTRRYVWLNARGDGSTFRWADGLNTPLFANRRGTPPWEPDEPDAFNVNWCVVFRYSRFNSPTNSWRDGEKMNGCLALNWFLCEF